MAVEDWFTTASDNVAVGGINIAENCPAGNVNNAIREMMAEIKTWTGEASFQAESANLTAIAELPFIADHLMLMTGTSAVAGQFISNFMKALLSTADAITLCNAIGAVRVAGITLANPGYLRLQVGSNQYFQVAWGTASVPAGGANILYAANFPTMGYPVIAGGAGGSGTQVNNPSVNASGIAANGFPVTNPRSETIPVSYVSVGY